MAQTQIIDLNWGIEDVYRMLMQNIEPELLPENYKSLSEKYANEKPADRKERYAHYADCFELFLERLEVLVNKLQRQVSGAYSDLRKQVEEVANANEEDSLNSFEDFLEST
tara:strand:- start:501 stop:833 length:333 start_codon:yes stop_codon:yes gene_type:complete